LLTRFCISKMEWRSCHGQSLTEVVVCLPVLLILFFAVIQVGIFYHAKHRAEMTNRFGMFASYHKTEQGQWQDKIKNTLFHEGSGEQVFIDGPAGRQAGEFRTDDENMPAEPPSGGFGLTVLKNLLNQAAGTKAITTQIQVKLIPFFGDRKFLVKNSAYYSDLSSWYKDEIKKSVKKMFGLNIKLPFQK